MSGLDWSGGPVILRQGHVLDELRRLPEAAAQAVITSPPYYGLRSYGTPPQDWGDWTGHLGLEPSLGLYISHLVDVFAAVWRVLRPDGVCWLNLGDSYATDPGNGRGSRPERATLAKGGGNPHRSGMDKTGCGLKPKDLCMVPHRVAIALQEWGWWVRSDVVWAKGSAMPESVQDRPTKAHEYIFLLTKAERYYYDAEAVREPLAGLWNPATNGPVGANGAARSRGNRFGQSGNGGSAPNPNGRNLRSVWHINPEPFEGAHFACFPPALVRRCLLAGTSERGACPCGASWLRSTQRSWSPSCACSPPQATVPCTVLDPFCGSGTTLAVAAQYGRRALGIELNPEYLKLARARLEPVLAQPALALEYD